MAPNNEGDIATNGPLNGSDPAAILVRDQALVSGDAAVGPDGNPLENIVVIGSSQVTGERSSQDRIELPPVEVPSLPNAGSLDVKGQTRTISEDGHYTQIWVYDQSRLTIQVSSGEVRRIVVDNFWVKDSEVRISGGVKLSFTLPPPARRK